MKDCTKFPSFTDDPAVVVDLIQKPMDLQAGDANNANDATEADATDGHDHVRQPAAVTDLRISVN